MRLRLLLSFGAALAVAGVTGCGGSSRQTETTTGVTVPAYGVFPSTTIEGSTSDRGHSEACRAGAGSFVDGAIDFLAHFGPRAAYPADLNYVIIRSSLADFRARRCDLRLLGRALERRLTPEQRDELIGNLPRAMATTVREAVARSS